MAIMLREVVIDLVHLLAILLAQFFEMSQGRLCHGATSFSLFRLNVSAASQSESADQRWKREPLENERDENHAEGQKDDHVALLEGLSIGEHLRQRNGGRERDDAAHARPADNKNGAHAGFGVLLMQDALADHVRHKGAGIDPDQAQENKENAEARGVHHKRAWPVVPDGVEDIRQLKTDQQKDEAVQDERE